MYGVGQVDRAKSITCAIIHMTGSKNYSILFWDWASVGLGLPENTRRCKGLQNHSRRLSLCREGSRAWGLSGRNTSSCRVRNNSLRITLR